jgi:hypothetical protein
MGHILRKIWILPWSVSRHKKRGGRQSLQPAQWLSSEVSSTSTPDDGINRR